MTAALVVEDCGPGTTLQDLGRTGWRRYGVSQSGAMDGFSLALANLLVGNPQGAAAIEFTLLGGRFKVQGGPVVLALIAPGAALKVSGRVVPPGQAVRAPNGASVAVSPITDGVYAYLALGGEIAGSPEMGSRSVHRRSGIGGTPLAPGDQLEIAGTAVPAAAPLPPLPDPTEPIRLIPGPQDDEFAPEALAALYAAGWIVDARSDRMGIRLQGPRLRHLGGHNIVSDGVLSGSVQVPGDGLPIVLHRDCQTTGGYPKIATVISADLDRLAQARPGRTVRFAVVDRASAVVALRARALQLAQFAAALRPTPAEDMPQDSARLLGLNLVGGVVDARQP